MCVAFELVFYYQHHHSHDDDDDDNMKYLLMCYKSSVPRLMAIDLMTTVFLGQKGAHTLISTHKVSNVQTCMHFYEHTDTDCTYFLSS